MNSIPKKLKEEMASDPYYEKCCLTGVSWLTEKVEWHHNLIFAGHQVQEKWCILPVSKSIHKTANRKDIKERLDWIMLNRTDEATLKKYSKAVDLVHRKKYLNEKYS